MPALQKQFRHSYRGEAEYAIGGRIYRERTFAHDDGYYNGDHYKRGIEPLVGCIIAEDSANWHSFPPKEVVDLFPGYVGARYAADFTVEYDGEKPRLILGPCGYTYSESAKEADDAELLRIEREAERKSEERRMCAAMVPGSSNWADED